MKRILPAVLTILLLFTGCGGNSSGNRSKTASQALTDLGYTNVYEFGGINTWLYEVVQ